MGRASVEDPLKEFRFRIFINGFQRAGFTECNGLGRQGEVAEYSEGGTETPQKSYSKTKYSDITLKRGQIIGSSRGGDDDMVKWVEQTHKLSALGTAENYRKTITIKQYNSLNVVVRQWRVNEAFPKDFKPFGDLKGEGNGNLYEEIVLAHEGFEKI